MTVSTEANEDRTRILMRVNDEHFVYQALGDQLELQREDFRPMNVTQTFDWHNDNNPLDTNGDGEVTPLDALLVINMINDNLVGDLPTNTVVNQIDRLSDDFKVDSNGDGSLTAIDALRIINRLNGNSVAKAAEPSQSARAAAAVDAVLANDVFGSADTDDDEEEHKAT